MRKDCWGGRGNLDRSIIFQHWKMGWWHLVSFVLSCAKTNGGSGRLDCPPSSKKRKQASNLKALGHEFYQLCLRRNFGNKLNVSIQNTNNLGVVAEADADKLILVSQPSSPSDDAIVSNSIVSLWACCSGCKALLVEARLSPNFVQVGWSNILEVFRQSTEQFLIDGVPRGRIVDAIFQSVPIGVIWIAHNPSTEGDGFRRVTCLEIWCFSRQLQTSFEALRLTSPQPSEPTPRTRSSRRAYLWNRIRLWFPRKRSNHQVYLCHRIYLQPRARWRQNSLHLAQWRVAIRGAPLPLLVRA